MAQIAPIYQGDAWKLEQALGLLAKDDRDADDAARLVEAGKICTGQAVRLLESGTKRGDLHAVIVALAEVSCRLVDSLADKALARLDDSLNSELEELKKENAGLMIWAAHLGASGLDHRYNA